MRAKKLLATLLSLAMVVSLFPASVMAAEYEDVSGHWAKEHIESFSGLGIVQGSDGLFRPNDPITRGEMAVILDRMMRYEVKADNTVSPSFTFIR